jgi:hypothetical protein
MEISPIDGGGSFPKKEQYPVGIRIYGLVTGFGASQGHQIRCDQNPSHIPLTVGPLKPIRHPKGIKRPVFLPFRTFVQDFVPLFFR